MTRKNTEYKLELLAADSRCRYCDRELTERTATIDHIRPRSRGGGNGKRNLTLSCKRCNMLKASMLPMEVLRLAIRMVAVTGRV